MLTVKLEDHGQDFLELDIDDHTIVGCRPFQASVWVGLPITNDDIKPGDKLRIGFLQKRSRFGGLQGAVIRWPVASIMQQEVAHHA